MPDVWVALDTSGGSKALGQIRREGLFQEFIYSYIDSKRGCPLQIPGYRHISDKF